MPAIIEAVGVQRIFRAAETEVRALDGVDFTAYEGSLTLLSGPSGSGKTTLMNILGALDLPDAGTVMFDGRDIGVLGEEERDGLRRRSLGFVFQTVGLLSFLTVRENVEYGLNIAGVPWEERSDLCERALHAVGLWNRRDHRSRELSGGEQQRVAIARALAARPTVVLADEPTSALDSALSVSIAALFKKICEEDGATVVMTSHDPQMAEIADRTFALRDGRME